MLTNGTSQVSDFNHYKALYVLVETYIRERDAQNPYDYIYSLEDENGTNRERGVRRTRDSTLKTSTFFGLLLPFLLLW